ncbi:MAG TPA: alpha-galactosidase [Candidatus Ratteibacteria bacterium]|nr:alpha-galactosidase [Candidatus Ratteibacteria bacterium]
MDKREIEETQKQVENWASICFTGKRLFPTPVQLKFIKQDFPVIRFGELPIKIGDKCFEHGLSTHANSEILVNIPKGAKVFKSFIGVGIDDTYDNNYDSQQFIASVIGSIEGKDKELVKTPVLKKGDKPFFIEIPLSSVQQITLKVNSITGSSSWPRADWADAQIIMEDGKNIYLDECQNNFLLLESENSPFSFIYNNIPSSSFINKWEKHIEKEEENNCIFYKISWIDPETSLLVKVDIKVFKDFPGIEWVVYFENKGSKDTPIIKDINALDISLATGNLHINPILHQLHGDSCDENTFLPFDTSLPLNEELKISPTGGRSSSISGFPFMNFQYLHQGVFLSIGWTGQWAVSFNRSKDQNYETHIKAGLELTHLKLHPGEKIRSPRILLMQWRQDRWEAHNLFRQLLLTHYVPKIDGKIPEMPIVLQTFDRYRTKPGWATEKGQIEAVKATYKLGCDAYWLDAAWFEGDFPNGVGNWYPKPKEFPNGLKPISDLCHKLGMKFILWVEPERVAPGTQIYKEHPEWVFTGEGRWLFKLNDPIARKWLTDLLCKIIDEFGVDVYRNDFNIDPLPFWRNNDEVDRQGITEIKYIEGLYEMWDELLKRHPGMMIDNCAGGGRRIDLETIMRSVPLWRSDTGCWPGHPEWNQTQSQGLSLYIPLFTGAIDSPCPYEFRSSQTSGVVCEWPYLDKDFPWELAKKMIKEVKENKKYWLGNFYSLTPPSKSLEQITVYQLHRPDIKEGIVYAFRRPECEYSGIIVSLREISSSSIYKFEFIDDSLKKTKKTIKGEELLKEGMEIRLPQKKSSLIIRYKEI